MSHLIINKLIAMDPDVGDAEVWRAKRIMADLLEQGCKRVGWWFRKDCSPQADLEATQRIRDNHFVCVGSDKRFILHWPPMFDLRSAVEHEAVPASVSAWCRSFDSGPFPPSSPLDFQECVFELLREKEGATPFDLCWFIVCDVGKTQNECPSTMDPMIIPCSPEHLIAFNPVCRSSHPGYYIVPWLSDVGHHGPPTTFQMHLANLRRLVAVPFLRSYISNLQFHRKDPKTTRMTSRPSV